MTEEEAVLVRMKRAVEREERIRTWMGKCMNAGQNIARLEEARWWQGQFATHSTDCTCCHCQRVKELESKVKDLTDAGAGIAAPSVPPSTEAAGS